MKYKILGIDFLLHLCCVLNVMEMVNVQDLSKLCWKISIWWLHVKTFLENLRDKDFGTTQLHVYSQQTHHFDNQIKKFHEQNLVNGWKLVS